MKDLPSTDLSDLFADYPSPTENAAAAGPRNGVESSAAYEIAFAKDSKNTPEFQAWAALDAAPQWCAWREELRKGKLTKVPYSTPQIKAAADNPATWITRARAGAVAADLLSGKRKGGVGLFLGGAGDLRFGGIDLDSCLGMLGDLTPWAEEVLARFPSYAEVSPSGTGVKVFFTYRVADLEPLRAIMGTQWGKTFSRGEHTEIGMFLGNKYFTVTGQRLDSAPATIETVDRAALEWLITDAGPRFKGEEPATAPKDESRSGRAFRIAGECRRAGLDLDAFKAELAKDPALAAWAKDSRQVRRAWDRNAGEDLSTLLSEMDDFDDAAPETGTRNPVTALNRDHAAVMIGGKFRIIREKGSDYDVFAPEELHKLNANNRVKVPGEKRTEPVTSAWMRLPSRRTYQGGLALALYTGQRRSDLVQFGKQHVRDGWLTFTQFKGRENRPVRLELPIIPELQRILDASPTGDLAFLATAYGKPFTAAGFGNRMREWCDKAGLSDCSTHGLRKAAASRLAELGCTEFEIMAITGHQTSKEVTRYTKAASQRLRAESALAKLTGTKS